MCVCGRHVRGREAAPAEGAALPGRTVHCRLTGVRRGSLPIRCGRRRPARHGDRTSPVLASAELPQPAQERSPLMPWGASRGALMAPAGAALGATKFASVLRVARRTRRGKPRDLRHFAGRTKAFANAIEHRPTAEVIALTAVSAKARSRSHSATMDRGASDASETRVATAGQPRPAEKTTVLRCRSSLGSVL